MIDKISRVLLLLFLLVLIALKKLGTSDEVTNGGIVISGLLCLIVAFFNGNKKIISLAIKYGLIMSVFFIMSYIYNANANFVNILWIWSFLGVAMLFYEKDLNKDIVLVLFVVYSAYTIYELIFMGVAASEITNTGSSNSVSAQSIFLLGIYYLSKYRDDKYLTIEYWPLLVIAVISILTATRSSLVALAFFLLFAVIFNLKNSQRKGLTILVLFVSVIVAVYLFVSYYDIYGAAFEAKTEKYGMESARSDIWSDYFRGTFDNIFNFLFGVPSSDSQYHYLFEYSGNTHNSFLMLHSKFGLGGFCLFVYVVIKGINVSIRRKQYIVFGVIMLTVLRSSFDWIAFPGYYDVFYWFILFYIKLERKLNSQMVVK